MDDVIEHWQRLEYAIQSVENSSAWQLSERIRGMAADREIFRRVLTEYYRNTFPVEGE